MNRRLVILGSIAIVLLAAVGLYRFHGSSGSTETSQNGKNTKAAAVPVTTTQARAEDFPIRRRTIGIMETMATVVVKSRLESQVTAQHVKDGQLVKKGELLFTLDDRAVKATMARDQAQIDKDQATADRTQVDLERYQRLAETNAAPRQQLDQATADHKIALATVAADKAQLSADSLLLDYATIEAPIGGRLGTIRVTSGNLVSVNDPTGLGTITQLRPIRVGFTLAERDLTALRKAYIAKEPAQVRVYAPGANDALATGTLDFVDSAVDSSSGTISAKGKFANDNFGLWPGMYADVEIDLAVRPKTVMIPAVAIQSGQKGPFVFVVKPDQTAAMRGVQLVGIEGDRAALESGVEDGEKIIVEGQMRLADGARVVEGAKPSGSGTTSGASNTSAPVAAEAQR